MEVDEIKCESLLVVYRNVTNEIQDLCASSNPSLLRKTSKEDLQKFSWNDVHEELKERTPVFLGFVEAAVRNPSQSRNVLKKNDVLIPPMCDAACHLVSVFNETMSAVRRIKSIILKKGGLKKIGFKRMAATYTCMGYNSTIKMFESFGKDFDGKLLMWKSKVEEDVQKEKELLNVVNHCDQTSSPDTANERLKKHREDMHPGYSFTGDNVDMILKPRQMMKSNQNKDYHMFQYVAYENRISANHLADEKQITDISKMPLTTFLPSVQEQEILAEELTTLVGLKWAEHIPSLKWFDKHLPDHIYHKHMEDVKKKTNKVGIDRKNVFVPTANHFTRAHPFSVYTSEPRKGQEIQKRIRAYC